MDYLKCGMCDHEQSLRYLPVWASKVDMDHLHDHYKRSHHDAVLLRIVKGDPAIAYSDYPEYKEIPSDPAPKVFFDGKEFEWRDLVDSVREWA